MDVFSLIPLSDPLDRDVIAKTKSSITLYQVDISLPQDRGAIVGIDIA